jgi:hypothetical protein
MNYLKLFSRVKVACAFCQLRLPTWHSFASRHMASRAWRSSSTLPPFKTNSFSNIYILPSEMVEIRTIIRGLIHYHTLNKYKQYRVQIGTTLCYRILPLVNRQYYLPDVLIGDIEKDNMAWGDFLKFLELFFNGQRCHGMVLEFSELFSMEKGDMTWDDFF